MGMVAIPAPFFAEEGGFAVNKPCLDGRGAQFPWYVEGKRCGGVAWKAPAGAAELHLDEGAVYQRVDHAVEGRCITAGHNAVVICERGIQDDFKERRHGDALPEVDVVEECLAWLL